MKVLSIIFRFSHLCLFFSILNLTIYSAFAYAEIELKLGHMFAAQSLPGKVADRFAELVADKSQGNIIIKVFGNGHFGDERNNLSLLNQGKLDFAVTGDLVISYLGNKHAVVNMPFIYSGPQHALSIYDGPLGETIREELKVQHGIDALSWHYVGTRMLTANRPIRNVHDLKGLNLRLPPDQVWMETWKALGAKPKSIQFTKLYSALKRKRVDAQENPPNFIRAQKFYEVQKYLILTNHIPQRQFIFSTDNLPKTLSPKQLRLVKQAAHEASAWATETAIANQDKDIEWLTKQGGMTLIQFDSKDVAKLIESTPSLLSGAYGEEIFQYIRQRK